MTLSSFVPLKVQIIPYQELLGNYDCRRIGNTAGSIIPYQELLGNYDGVPADAHHKLIIPYQELLGNYDNNRHDRIIV